MALRRLAFLRYGSLEIHFNIARDHRCHLHLTGGGAFPGGRSFD
jgi:hypothetical protein